MSQIRTSFSLLPALLLLCSFLALATGCQTGMQLGGRSFESAEQLPTPQLQAEADTAFAEQRWARSEFYYQRLAERNDLPGTQRPVVLRKLADSALRADHPMQARFALEQWAAASPDAVNDWQYNALLLDAYRALGQEEPLAQLKDRLLHDEKLPWAVRYRAGVRLGLGYAADGHETRGLDILAEFYDRAPGPDQRASMEQATFEGLQRLADIDRASRAVAPAKRLAYPGALVLFEQARRSARQNAEQWEQSWKIMRGILANANLADKLFLGDILLALERTNGQPRTGVVLLLPVTGKYQAVGRKIVRGAGAAQWMLANQGVELDIKVINTDAPDWLKRLSALPPQYAVVGGPLRVSSFKTLEQSGELSRRAVFGFLPSLGDVGEGQQAWRFFPSREDEVRTLVRLASERLGVSRFGVLYPEEPFGTDMASIFRQVTLQTGGTIASQRSYPPKTSPDWGERIAELLKVPDSFDKEAPLPPTDFQAVFLPDGWSQAQLLVPNFFFYDATDMLFLGPSLWSSALERVSDVEETYFKLAVCPGAWNPQSPGAVKLQQLLDSEGLGPADMWVALGYDWLRMSAGLGGLPQGWTPAQVTARLQRLNMEYSMAPMGWDADGMAFQQLYLFRPGADGGAVLVDPEQLAQRLEAARAKRKHRQILWEENQSEQ
ncbi:hypothetical protein SAMN02745704_00683 [Paucidesulfovibrio gracilis DSM 16080]|uniref:ABC-type branched-chain amino acid transport system, substrate-binding protein n=1 Tax=Paucidesulfovibrio gracilis DSM 16080 TaxID=1121449 RepID=A0A1T4WBU1_9BACT|nr:penicillin-binding protein activator [Paucidesulfovibrio gracilis]SKA74518.1 hypothetical protein SAMN02745704_00683 [Paucidesulfovibrio gracilis DSM 16080]